MKLLSIAILATLIPLTGAGNSGPPATTSAAAPYTGPGDVVASAAFWLGLRAYSNALANAGATTTPVIDVLGSTTATGCTIYLLGNGTGGLDLATAGAGGVGNQCLLGATHFCTVTNSSCTVSKLYDQSGHGQSPIESTAAKQPTIAFSCLGSLPCMQFNGTTSSLGKASGVTAISAPMAVVAVAENASTAQASLWFDSSNNQLGYHNSAANQSFFFGGSGVAVQTASDGAHHSVIADVNSSGNAAVIYVDDVAGSPNNAGNGAGGTALFLGSLNGTGQLFTGDLEEIGQWAIQFSGTQATNMCHNQFTYWGTAASC